MDERANTKVCDCDHVDCPKCGPRIAKRVMIYPQITELAKKFTRDHYDEEYADVTDLVDFAIDILEWAANATPAQPEKTFDYQEGYVAGMRDAKKAAAKKAAPEAVIPPVIEGTSQCAICGDAVPQGCGTPAQPECNCGLPKYAYHRVDCPRFAPLTPPAPRPMTDFDKGVQTGIEIGRMQAAPLSQDAQHIEAPPQNPILPRQPGEWNKKSPFTPPAQSSEKPPGEKVKPQKEWNSLPKPKKRLRGEGE